MSTLTQEAFVLIIHIGGKKKILLNEMLNLETVPMRYFYVSEIDQVQ